VTTKREAAEKVAKLRRLADSTKNPHEKATARRQADKLAAEYGLGKEDLDAGKMAAAFDDLVGAVERVVENAPIPKGIFDTGSIIREVTGKIRKLDDADKSKKLRQVATAVRVAAMIAGDNKTVAELKAVLDSVLKSHDLTV